MDSDAGDDWEERKKTSDKKIALLIEKTDNNLENPKNIRRNSNNNWRFCKSDLVIERQRKEWLYLEAMTTKRSSVNFF